MNATAAHRYSAAAVTLSAVFLAASCEDSSTSSCSADRSLRFVIHLDVEAAPPGELGVQYANATIDNFDRLLPDAPWPNPIVICAAPSADAVDGAATGYFTARPEGARRATAELVVDLSRQVTVELTLELLSDGGVGPDATRPNIDIEPYYEECTLEPDTCPAPYVCVEYCEACPSGGPFRCFQPCEVDSACPAPFLCNGDSENTSATPPGYCSERV